jgi:hypothetical protein
MPSPVATENKSNCDGDKMCAKCMERQEKYMNFEGADTVTNTTTPNINSDWKSLLPIIAVTSLVTASLIVVLKGTR